MAIHEYYCRLCSLCLMGTALFKLISALGHAKLLSVYDPIFLIPNRYVFAGVGLLESAVAIYLLGKAPTVKKLLVVLWLSSVFVLYRLSKFLLDIGEPCSCLGNAADWFPWLAPYINSILTSVLVFLFAGSFGFLVEASLKGSCACNLTENRAGESRS